MASRPELKLDDEPGFIKYFRTLSQSGNDAIKFFDRGDFYTAHGEDAIYIATTIYKSTSVIRHLGRQGSTLESVTLSITVFKNFLREALFRLGRRIEIYENSSRSSSNWKLSKHASPGNLQHVEDQLGESLGETSPMILSIKISSKANQLRQVGVCFADATVRELGISEFADNESYSNFESLIIQLGIKEVLIQSDVGGKDIELKKIEQIVENCGCAITPVTATNFNNKDVHDDFDRLLRDANTIKHLPQTDLRLAMSASASLIKYLGLMTNASNFGQYALFTHNLEDYMKLDAPALRALNLMPGPRDGSKTMSLFGLLNHCKTPMGPRLLAQWLKQPLMNLTQIEHRQILVESFVVDTELRQTIQEEYLRSTPDLYRLSKKFQRNKANLEDVVRAYQASLKLPGILGTFEAVIDDKYKDSLDSEYTEKLEKIHNNLDKFQELVESTIDIEATDRHEFIIKEEYDESLQLIKSKLDDTKSQMNSELKKASKALGLEIEKKIFMENNKTHGWCFRVTRAEASAIRSQRDYKEITTNKAGTYFTCTNLQTLKREFDTLNSNYSRVQESVATQVIGVAASYCPVFENFGSVIAHLDVIISFAHISCHAPIPYVKPKMNKRGTGNTILKEARHPCMEVQDDMNFITNDVSLIRGESEFVIITGPNMGGKSTFIRQIGVIALLAQTGCFVPCSEAELCIFDCILARVGASDSQLKGVSTFMAEMLETANILRCATRDSLIIIDELGRGTSTYDGFGLAWAISEHIVKEIGAFALFATHFHELTALADQWKQVQNLHVEAHIDDDDDDGDSANAGNNKKRQVTLLYKVTEGISERSFGIHVAEIVRFPEKVINMAKRKADELEDFEGKHENLDNIAPEEVERGSELLKQVLTKWKSETEEKDLTPEEQIKIMRNLVNGNEELLNSPFFKGVLAL